MSDSPPRRWVLQEILTEGGCDYDTYILNDGCGRHQAFLALRSSGPQPSVNTLLGFLNDEICFHEIEAERGRSV